MKKLTAGIFTVMLGIVGMGVANAEIASKAYVDQTTGSVETKVENLTQIVNTNAGTAESNKEAIETLTSQLEGKADTSALNTLAGRVDANANSITTLNGSGEGSVAKKITDALTPYAKTADVATQIQGATSGLLNETDADTKYAPIATQTTANANKAAIDKLNGTAETTGSILNTLKPYIKTATVNNMLTHKASTDDLDAVEAKADGNTTKIEAINNAETGILAQAKADATAKADAAKSYADTEIGKVNTKFGDYALTTYVNTEVGKKVSTDTYNTQIGVVNPTNMGASASATTVVAGVKEANDAVKVNAKQIADNKTAIDSSLAELGTDVESRLPRPTDACADPTNKCVLVSAGKGNYTWEVIERGTSEVSGN